MTESEKQSSNFTVNKLLIDFLEDDGVICNALNKEYDEQATYKGGLGNRQRFTLENDKITAFHQLLKILKGEWRANIHEAIPAIDFLNKENTSIMNTYLVEDDKVHADTIMPIPASLGSVIQDIINDDPYTLNRAVTGGEVAEHFYNSTGGMSEANCLVSPPSESLANFAYVYKGICNKVQTIYDADGDSVTSSAVRLDKIIFIAPRIGETCVVTYDPDKADTTGTTTDAWGNSGSKDEHGTLILREKFLDALEGNFFVTEGTSALTGSSALAQLVSSKSSSAKGLSITLNSGDFCIIIPSSLTSLDSSRIIVAKKDIENNGFNYFIAYATSVSYAAEAVSLNLDDAIPNLPDASEEGKPLDTATITFLSNYIAIEKEYYSKASGLLCGAFSEPKETTDLGSDRVVNKWKYINDTDEAAKRNTSVPIGSKLYPNYLLGRGSIMDAPLATSETYVENGVTKTYDGLATYLYDNIRRQFTNIYEKYETDTSTWNSHPDHILNGVLTKEDWSSRIMPSVINPSKFRMADNRYIGYDEINAYINRAVDSLVPNDDGTYTVNLSKNDPAVEYCYRTDQNTGAFDWGWVRTKSSWQGNGASGNTLASDYNHIYRLQWTVRLKKNGKVVDSCRDLSMKVMSPYQAFRPSRATFKSWTTSTVNRLTRLVRGESGTALKTDTFSSSYQPYLLWPSEKNYFPPELLLLSVEPLNVTVGDNGNNTICFYNDAQNTSIIFEVTGILEFPASKISRVAWYNDPINDYSSSDVVVDNAAEHDCYVYTLRHLSADLEDIRFRDKAGNVLADLSYLNASIVPLSYPKEYFKCDIVRGTNGEFNYTLRDSVAKRSLSMLDQSVIITGMLPLKKLIDNNVQDIPDHKLSSFRGLQKLFSTGSSYDIAISSLIKDSLYTLLYNRPVSEKTDIMDTGELIVLGELPELIEGLRTLPPYIEDIIKAGIVVNNKKLTTYDFEDFYKRLETFESFKAYPDFALSYVAIDNNTVLNGKPIRTFIDNLLPSEPGKFSASAINSAFRQTVEAAVRSSIKFVNTGSSTPVKPRPSLASLANTLKHIFSTSANAGLSREDCVTIDKYFGNDTKAFLVTREDPSEDVIPEAAAALMENTVDAYAEIIADVDAIFKSVAKEKETTAIVRELAPEAYANFETDLAQLKVATQQIYERYFKPESIEIYGTINLSVNTSKLQLDPRKVTADFNALKNDPNRYVRYQYGWSWNYDYSTGGNIFKRAARKVANAAFYAAFRVFFGRSAWNTCDTVIRTWPSMSLDSFVSKYALYSSTTAGLSNADARIHNYLIDTVTANRKSIVKAEASRETAAKVQYLISQQQKLNEAKKQATQYTDKVYLPLSSNVFSNTINSLLMSWFRRLNFFSAVNVKGYIEKWLEDTDIKDIQATRYSKIDNNYVVADNGAFIKGSDIKSQYSGYYNGLIEDGYLQGNQRSISLELPYYRSAEDKSKLAASGSRITFEFPPYRVEKLDIDNNLLEGVATYARTALEGTSPTGTNDYFVRFEPGDKDVTGRFNSLYYERYLYLNARLNKSTGTLYRAAQFDQSGKIFTTNNAIEDQLKRVNKKYFTSIPVEWAHELAYFKPQMLQKMNTFFPGKFYYKEQLLDIARQINDKCMLTCGYCPVKDNCPFYGEDEVLKMACTSVPSIDLYVKDNEPDLLYYDEGVVTQVNGKTEVVGRSPAVYYEEAGSKEELSHELLQSYSRPYASISKKTLATRSENGDLIYESDYSDMYRDLTELEEETKRVIGGLDYKTEVPSGLGWLTGGRWGTFQRNRLSDSTSGMSSPDYPAENFPHNKYFYDAVFLNDEDSEVLYAPSQNWYDVEVSTAETADSDGTPKTYKGKTRIKIPVALKAFAERPTGDVYLVSDDTMDDQGNPITPVIYLGKVEDVRYAFDLREEGSNQDEVTTSADTRIYPKDVAQWSINVAKGNCLHDRIDPDAFTKTDNSTDALSHGYDQYWMENLKKRVVVNGEERILELPGRTRRNAGYSEVVVDPDNMNEYEVISGKPVAANRINFMRRISLRIYDDNAVTSTNDGYTMIPWCKEPGDPSKPTADSLYIDTQKSVLPFMKTNLRLVVCEIEQ